MVLAMERKDASGRRGQLLRDTCAHRERVDGTHTPVTADATLCVARTDDVPRVGSELLAKASNGLR